MNTQSPIRSFDTLGTTHLFFFISFYANFSQRLMKTSILEPRLVFLPKFHTFMDNYNCLNRFSSFINCFSDILGSFFIIPTFFFPYSFYTTMHVT